MRSGSRRVVGRAARRTGRVARRLPGLTARLPLRPTARRAERTPRPTARRAPRPILVGILPICTEHTSFRRPMTEILTDERRAFVEAIRDFCARECGTREQRMKLTGDGREAHNQALYERMAALG